MAAGGASQTTVRIDHLGSREDADDHSAGLTGRGQDAALTPAAPGAADAAGPGPHSEWQGLEGPLSILRRQGGPGRRGRRVLMGAGVCGSQSKTHLAERTSWDSRRFGFALWHTPLQRRMQVRVSVCLQLTGLHWNVQPRGGIQSRTILVQRDCPWLCRSLSAPALPTRCQ